MGPHLRRARPADHAGISAAIAEAYADAARRIPDLPPVAEGIAEDIAENTVWVAVGLSEIVGVMVLVAGADHLKLSNIAITPAARGAGLARRFLALAIDAAQGAAQGAGLGAGLGVGLGELRLVTHAEMTDNLALYAHLGWHETGRRGNAVMMARPVPAPIAGFTLNRLSDDVTYHFRRDARGFRRTDADHWIIRHPDLGWIARDDQSGAIMGRPWSPPDPQGHMAPPEGIWVSRKGDKSFVYRLIHGDPPTAS